MKGDQRMTIFTQKRLLQIMKGNPGQRETALREFAQELGCSLSSSYTSGSIHLEEEIVRRIQESMRSIRESRMWWIAFISAIASVFSALAAWFAVWRN
jgi:hypothetical protein